jgi:glutamyl-tRNA reductase
MLENFYAIGVSYIKTDAETRGKFSIDGARGEALSQDARKMGIEALLVISTCNRTELYGFATSPEQLIDLLCIHTKGNTALFRAEGYVFQNEKALSHLFRVGTGLDSQILGDFEIISQIKQAFRRSKALKLSNVYLERLVNAVTQASKRIKNQTEISSGATSVSFASVRYLLENIPDISEKSLLLFGTGKIGRNTCENLVKHTSNKHITLINRTRSTAEEIAGKFELNVKGYEDLQSEIRKADVLIVATSAQKPTVTKALLYLKKPLTILDLSVPKNVASEVTELDKVKVVDIDDLSKITDDTLERRKSQVPMAEAIIAEIQGEFLTWADNRKFAATIAALKERLSQFKEEERAFLLKKSKNTSGAKHSEVIDDFGDRLVQKITKQFANFLRASDDDLEQKMQLIESLFELEKEGE